MEDRVVGNVPRSAEDATLDPLPKGRNGVVSLRRHGHTPAEAREGLAEATLGSER